MMMNRIKKFLAAGLFAVAGLSLAGCQSVVPDPAFPELTFRHLGVIELDVARLENVSAYKPSMESPNVGHLFPVSPQNALDRWADDRLLAGGTAGLARFTILDASVRETALEIKQGLKGAFTRDQSERYQAVLSARLEIFDDTGRRKGFATATADRSITVREDATVNDRQQAWFNLVESLMRDFNAELEKNISRYLAAWLK